MYVVSMILFLVILILSVSIWSMATLYVDLPSLVLIVTFTVPILFASGLHMDFLKSFKLMRSKENLFSVIELKRMLQAVKLVIKTTLTSGILGSLIGSIAILSKGTFVLGHFSVAMISLLYGIIFVLVLLPIEARIKATIDTF